MRGALYVVATPIGNLDDITLRALAVLSAVDVVLCEDSRVTDRLLAAHGIRASLWVYHEHAHKNMLEKIQLALSAGKTLALVSDAGTPGISDPGYALIAELRAQEFPIYAVPGASVLTAAISIAAPAAGPFLFVGFLPDKKQMRDDLWQRILLVNSVSVFFVSARELPKFLEEAEEKLGNCQVAVTRELTKHYEQVVCGRLSEVRDKFFEAPKGEVVVLIAAAEKNQVTADEALYQPVLEALLAQKPLREAVDMVQKISQVPRNFLYDLALKIKNSE